MSLCRHCGRDPGTSQTPDGACVACSNSPHCAVCGHERSDHAGVFTPGAVPTCQVQVGDFQSLDFGQCDCEGFRPIEGASVDPEFEDLDADPLAGPPLRLA